MLQLKQKGAGNRPQWLVEKRLFNLGGSDCVKVNGTVLEKSQVLNAGDTFSVGDQSFDVEDPKLAKRKIQRLPTSRLYWKAHKLLADQKTAISV